MCEVRRWGGISHGDDGTSVVMVLKEMGMPCLYFVPRGSPPRTSPVSCSTSHSALYVCLINNLGDRDIMTSQHTGCFRRGGPVSLAGPGDRGQRKGPPNGRLTLDGEVLSFFPCLWKPEFLGKFFFGSGCFISIFRMRLVSNCSHMSVLCTCEMLTTCCLSSGSCSFIALDSTSTESTNPRLT